MLKPLFAAVSIFALSISSFADSATVQSKLTPSPSKIQTDVTGSQALNRLDVNGEKSSRITYQRLGVFGAYALSWLDIGFQVENLNRERVDYATAVRFEKETQIYAPGIGFRFNDSIALHLDHSMYVTNTKMESYEKKVYSQNASRSSISLITTSATNAYHLTLLSELRGEEDYMLGQYPMVDREYVPAQVKFGWVNSSMGKLSLNSGVTYSHYNSDIYKDQYESDVPTTPTMAQVFDYLLTLKFGATFAVLPQWNLAVDLLRKAALDVSSYTGDEYVLSYVGNAEITHNFSDSLALALGVGLSNGQKTHEVQSQSYKYASRVESYGAKLAANL